MNINDIGIIIKVNNLRLYEIYQLESIRIWFAANIMALMKYSKVNLKNFHRYKSYRKIKCPRDKEYSE